MKNMKLSMKLFIGLMCILLGILVWQVLITDHVLTNEKKIKTAKSSQELFDILQDSKIFKFTSFAPFSKIIIKDCISVEIQKGKEFGVFINDYRNNEAEVMFENGTLIIQKHTKKDLIRHPVFIFMPDEPEKIEIPDACFKICHIYGFRGDRLTIHPDNADVCLKTDLQYLNIYQQDSKVTLQIIPKYKAENHMTNLSLVSEKSSFELQNKAPGEINADMILFDSFFMLDLSNFTKIGKINIEGSLGNGPTSDFQRGANNTSWIRHVGVCDSFMIHLNSSLGSSPELVIPSKIVGNYVNIQCFDNIRLVKHD